MIRVVSLTGRRRARLLAGAADDPVAGGRPGLFPTGGYINPADSFTGWLKSMTLPALSLSLPVAAQLTRIVRTSVVEELDRDYVRTAVGERAAAAGGGRAATCCATP